MAQTQNPRRYYIDHADDHTVVRAVPVRYVTPEPAAPESIATHQFAPSTSHPGAARTLAARARRAPKAVSRIVHSARKRPGMPRS